MSKNTNHPQIIALLNGDEKIIKLIYKTLYPKVKSFIYKNKGNSLDAEEIFHKALYQLIVKAKIKTIQINTTLEAYLFTICKYLWYQELNNRKKEVRNDSIFELKSEDFQAEQILQQERWLLFEEKILELSENCQDLLQAYFKKVPYNKIIKKFDYATKNVAFQRIFKCKKKLTDLIKSDSRFKKL